MTKKKILLTQEGYDKLVEKLNYLKSVKRIEVADRLKAAIALGDLSENSEYVDAKAEQAFMEGEIAELESKIHNSEIIEDNSNGEVVGIGSKVVIRDLEFNEDETYKIVGSDEADPDSNKISNESPIGAAIIGQTAGTTVQVHAPAGIFQYKIMEIVRK